MKHLEDAEIQRYLEGTCGDETGALERHIEACGLCTSRLEEYRLLFSQLAEDTAMPVFSDLPDRVIARLTSIDHATAPSREQSWRFDLVLAGSGVLIAAVAVFVFVGLGSLPHGLTHKLLW